MSDLPLPSAAPARISLWRRRAWPWSLLAAGIGLVMALAFIGLGSGGGEEREGTIYLNMLCAFPAGLLLLPVGAVAGFWCSYLLASWMLNGLLPGSFVGLLARRDRVAPSVTAIALLATWLTIPVVVCLVLALRN